jgi:hypothetical protein
MGLFKKKEKNSALESQLEDIKNQVFQSYNSINENMRDLRYQNLNPSEVSTSRENVQCKIFFENSYDKLEDNINEFLSTGIEIHHTQVTTSPGGLYVTIFYNTQVTQLNS